MKIVLFTSNTKGALNTFNIKTLIKNCPNHNYIIVNLNNKPKRIGNWLKFKRFIVELRDGKDYWRRDLKSLEKKIIQSFPKVNLKKIKTYQVSSVNGELTEQIIKESSPDIVIQAGAGILKENIFSIPKYGTLNVHHGFAPEIRGIKSTYWCLHYGLHNLIGVTCHYIDKTLDTGPVIKQYRYNYNPSTSFIDIQLDLCKNGAKILTESVNEIEKSKDWHLDKKEIKSYYFSGVSPKDYNKLKAQNFLPISDKSELKYKIKIKSTLKPN